MGLTRVLFPEVGRLLRPGSSGERLAGAHLVARECHFSLGSPSRKLVSAHRGCGLPSEEIPQSETCVMAVSAVRERGFYLLIP